MSEENNEDRIRVLRLIEYEGPRSLVESQVARSIQGTRLFRGRDNLQGRITAVTLGAYPEVIEAARVVADPMALAEASNQIVHLQQRLNEELVAQGYPALYWVAQGWTVGDSGSGKGRV